MTHQLFTLFWIIGNILTFHFYTFSVLYTFYFYIAFEELTFYQKCSIKCVLYSLFYRLMLVGTGLIKDSIFGQDNGLWWALSCRIAWSLMFTIYFEKFWQKLLLCDSIAWILDQDAMSIPTLLYLEGSSKQNRSIHDIGS